MVQKAALSKNAQRVAPQESKRTEWLDSRTTCNLNFETRPRWQKQDTRIFANLSLSLVQRLDGHPLALATAGAFLKNSQLSFAHYLQLYESKWNVTGHRARPLREYRDRTLYTTWNISFTRVEQEDPEAAQLLKLLAYFDNQNVWFELLRAGSGDSTPSWFP